MAADMLTGIRVFCRVVELKSFAGAARQLNSKVRSFLDFMSEAEAAEAA